MCSALPGEPQPSCLLVFTIKGDPTGGSLTHRNTPVHRSHRLSDSAWGFLPLVFSPHSARTIVPLPSCAQESQLGDALALGGVYRTFSHPSPPPCHYKNLSSSSPHLQISDQYPRGAVRSEIWDRPLRSIWLVMLSVLTKNTGKQKSWISVRFSSCSLQISQYTQGTESNVDTLMAIKYFIFDTINESLLIGIETHWR